MTKKHFESIAKALKDTCYMNDVNHISISSMFIEFLLLYFKEENKNFVDKKKGVQGPQTKEAQNYEDKQGRVPFKKKKITRTVTKGRREGAPKSKYKTVEYADKTGKVVRSKRVTSGPTGRKVTKRQGDMYSDIVKEKVKQKYPQNKR